MVHFFRDSKINMDINMNIDMNIVDFSQSLDRYLFLLIADLDNFFLFLFFLLQYHLCMLCFSFSMI